jgi:hypothetical protein
VREVEVGRRFSVAGRGHDGVFVRTEVWELISLDTYVCVKRIGAEVHKGMLGGLF